MSEIAGWVADAVRALGLNARELSQDEASRISEAARAKFVRGNPRAWWLDWAVPCEHFETAQVSLPEVLPIQAGPVFFLPENDESPDEPPVVYEVDARDLERLIGECPYFEYYVMPPDLSWIVAESEHDVFFRCHAPE